MKKSIFKFKIIGNQEDPAGNAIPYLRYTRNQYWTDKVKRYHAWKDYVNISFTDCLPLKLCQEALLRIVRNQKPLDIGDRKAVMNITIQWANNRHGDYDNIWKGIADALFESDKNVTGSFKEGSSGVGPAVVVEIVIY